MESIDTNVDHFYGRNIRVQLLSLYIGIQQAFLSSLIKIGLNHPITKKDEGTKINFPCKI